MPRTQKVENVYLESAKKLRASLPKFFVFLGAAFLVWIFGSALLIPLGTGVFLGGVETSKIINLLVLGSLVVLIITSFREIKNVANSLAGLALYYIGGNSNNEKLRLQKLQSTFRSFSYVILAAVFFILFRGFLLEIHPALAGIVVILLAIWAIVSLYAVVMAMSGEIEEAASSFAERIEQRVKRRK
jgi:hypothetical protein